MPLTFTDPTSIELSSYIDSGLLRVDCEGSTLPVNDQVIICEVSPGASVAFDLEFNDSDSNRTISASHYDANGQQHTWASGNPCSYSFGLTGGYVDVTATATASGQTKITIVKIEVKPKTEKPFKV
ncbi:MAG: hypothetical protein KC431_03650 [Myxococcales bacterium]|nr:hypothetical protein [Myxococcales bacterium]